MSKLTSREIIELLGGITVVARMLDIKPPSVHAWLKDGIPETRLVALAAQIELKSDGRFSRRQHWPEKFTIYWPELAQQDRIGTIGAPLAMAPIMNSQQPVGQGV